MDAARHALCSFLCTKSHPPLYWMPAMPCPATDKLLEEQKLKFEEWKVSNRRAEDSVERCQGELTRGREAEARGTEDEELKIRNLKY
eukprot:1160403-Pelagomonas_calceolata.AAC.12